MPKYYVYNRQSGQIIHTHETVDAISGASLPTTSEDILALVDAPDKSSLEVTQAEATGHESERALRVDTSTNQVVFASGE